MAKDKGSDKGKKLRAAKRALADAEKGADAGNLEVAGSPDKRQKEDGDDGGKPKKKQKQVADKAQAGYRDKDAEPRKKIIAQKSQGTLPQKGFQGVDTEADSI
jgi:hypothetical protein